MSETPRRLGGRGRLTLSAGMAAALIGAFGPVASAATVAAPAQARATSHSLIGKWSMAGGIFKYVKTGTNTYKDKVIKKRPGVFCPSVNDKSGQIVMHKRGTDLYKGTWKWFNTATCAFVGLGATSIKISKSGSTAVFHSDPPKGTTGSPETFHLKRLK